MAEPNLFSLAKGIPDFVECDGQEIVHISERKPAPPTNGSSQCFFFHFLCFLNRLSGTRKAPRIEWD